MLQLAAGALLFSRVAPRVRLQSLILAASGALALLAARAGGAVANGVVYVPYKSGDIAAIRVTGGTLIGNKHIGGAFGPPSPVIVGGTLHVTNIFR